MEEQLKQIGHTDPNCVKVVLYGPESTGKSSLAKALAAYYDTNYVEEFSRHYAQSKMAAGIALDKTDVLPIAIGQMQLENAQSKCANQLLICDTDLLETQVYSQYYYDGFCPDPVKKYALENTYDLYFLTYIDTVWVADGIRDRPLERLEMFEAFEQALIATQKPYVIIKGDFEARLKSCKTHIDKLLNKKH